MYQLSSCRTASLRRESTLVLGTQSSNWHPCGRRGGGRNRAHRVAGSFLSLSGEEVESHGVNPETRNGYKEWPVIVISTGFPQLWKLQMCLLFAFMRVFRE